MLRFPVAPAWGKRGPTGCVTMRRPSGCGLCGWRPEKLCCSQGGPQGCRVRESGQAMAGEIDAAGQCRSGGGREQVPSACGECGRSMEGKGSGVVLGGHDPDSEPVSGYAFRGQGLPEQLRCRAGIGAARDDPELVASHSRRPGTLMATGFGAASSPHPAQQEPPVSGCCTVSGAVVSAAAAFA